MTTKAQKQLLCESWRKKLAIKVMLLNVLQVCIAFQVWCVLGDKLLKISHAVDSSVYTRIDSLGVLYGQNSDGFYFVG